MKAVDYFREYGLVESKKHLEWMVRVEARQDIHGWFMDNLKRLVESHELIEQYNGLFEEKELIRVSPKMTSELREVAAAIADVESCQ